MVSISDQQICQFAQRFYVSSTILVADLRETPHLFAQKCFLSFFVPHLPQCVYHVPINPNSLDVISQYCSGRAGGPAIFAIALCIDSFIQRL